MKMDLEQARNKLIYHVTMSLPGYAQLLPRAQLNLQYEIKQVLKQYSKTLLDGHTDKSCVAKPQAKEGSCKDAECH